MKLLLVTLIAVAAIAVNICETNAFPADVDGEGADREVAVAPADRDCWDCYRRAMNLAPTDRDCDDCYPDLDLDHHHHHGRAMEVAPDA